jgi:chromate reductase
MIQVLGMAGSLRRASYNRMLLESTRALAPDDMRIEVFDLRDVPMYNGDLDTDAERPAEAQRLKQAIAGADAVLIATPEYNHSVPGMLKNAIDWASRPALKCVFTGKPVAIMGAAGGPVGTARAQQDLKLILMSMLALVLPHPGVAVGHMAEKFDASGALVHEPTRQFLTTFLVEFRSWVTRHAPADHKRQQ